MASEPKDDNVILVEDYSKLDEVDQQLTDTSCNGQLSLVITIVVINVYKRFLFFYKNAFFNVLLFFQRFFYLKKTLYN